MKTLVRANLYLLLRLSRILFISNVLRSSILNKLNALSAYEPGFGLYLAKLCSRDKYCTTSLLMQVPALKVGVYLILEVHSMLFKDPT